MPDPINPLAALIGELFGMEVPKEGEEPKAFFVPFADVRSDKDKSVPPGTLADILAHSLGKGIKEALVSPILKAGKGVKGGTMKPPNPDPVVYEDNNIILRKHGLKVMHFQNDETPHMGMTVAYRFPQQYVGHHASTIEIATALTHPKDNFSKKAGTRVAVENFLAGHKITIPVVKGVSVTDMLKLYFNTLVG